MADITNREDIKTLVDAFYKKVVVDPVISHFFNQVAHFSWDVHIPIMISFWESILLDPGAYAGNPMQQHFALNKISPMLELHFNQWMHLWKGTVHELFEGEVAELAITRASSIAQIMQYKMAAAL